MKILLDECLPVDLRYQFQGHEVHTARWAGFSGLTNGELLRACDQSGYSVMLTADQGIAHQQNRANQAVSIVILCAPTNQLEDLQPLVEKVMGVLDSLSPGSLVRIT